MSAIAVCGYVLIAAEAALVGVIVVYYGRALRAAPNVRRLLPIHVILVGVGTLLVSGIAVARMVQYPHGFWWDAGTILGVGMIVAALGLVLRWQRESAPGRCPL